MGSFDDDGEGKEELEQPTLFLPLFDVHKWSLSQLVEHLFDVHKWSLSQLVEHEVSVDVDWLMSSIEVSIFYLNYFNN